jgi:hypothetical protein
MLELLKAAQLVVRMAGRKADLLDYWTIETRVDSMVHLWVVDLDVMKAWKLVA